MLVEITIIMSTQHSNGPKKQKFHKMVEKKDRQGGKEKTEEEK